MFQPDLEILSIQCRLVVLALQRVLLDLVILQVQRVQMVR